MALINVDPAPLYDTDFNEEFENWLSTLVDEINSNFEAIKWEVSDDIGGGGAGPIDVEVAGMTADSVVIASMVSSSNPASIIAVTPTTDKFTVTFSADPGASAIISYTTRLY